MANYKYKYLRVREKPDNLGKTVCRVNITHLNAKGRKAEWDRLDAKYPTDKYISCYEQTNDVLRCWEDDPIVIPFEETAVKIVEKYPIPDVEGASPWLSKELVEKLEALPQNSMVIASNSTKTEETT